MNLVDACKILNINAFELNNNTLKKKYRIACLKYHPDKTGGSSDDFIKVKEAFEYLKDDLSKKNKTNINIDSETILFYINLFKKFNYTLVDVFIIDPIVNCLKKKSYELNPSLKHLMNKELYYLEEYKLYVPLWHQEVIYDNIIININPQLPDNVYIDDDNNIHILIIKNDDIHFELGGISFSFQNNIQNIVVLKGKGIPKINIKNIYDCTELSNIVIHVN
uniref:J domain-containing protein n=1 Tax=viral metagenome TaxID=1070528 RepID=A0A6C0JIQ2_9ZZZZ